MTNTEQVLTVTEQYRTQLTTADDKEAIREQQEWFRQEAAQLFKPGTTQPNN